jgi:hypothetical protein
VLLEQRHDVALPVLLRLADAALERRQREAGRPELDGEVWQVMRLVHDDDEVGEVGAEAFKESLPDAGEKR